MTVSPDSYGLLSASYPNVFESFECRYCISQKKAQMVICDFRGLEAPEMIKTRPVVVLRRNYHNSALVVVVPISSTKPAEILGHRVEFTSPLPGQEKACWAKCDMLYTVGIARLDRIKIKDRNTGQRTYVAIPLPAELLVAIRAGVRCALGL